MKEQQLGLPQEGKDGEQKEDQDGTGGPEPDQAQMSPVKSRSSSSSLTVNAPEEDDDDDEYDYDVPLQETPPPSSGPSSMDSSPTSPSSKPTKPFLIYSDLINDLQMKKAREEAGEKKGTSAQLSPTQSKANNVEAFVGKKRSSSSSSSGRGTRFKRDNLGDKVWDTMNNRRTNEYEKALTVEVNQHQEEVEATWGLFQDPSQGGAGDGNNNNNNNDEGYDEEQQNQHGISVSSFYAGGQPSPNSPFFGGSTTKARQRLSFADAGGGDGDTGTRNKQQLRARRGILAGMENHPGINNRGSGRSERQTDSSPDKVEEPAIVDPDLIFFPNTGENKLWVFL